VETVEIAGVLNIARSERKTFHDSSYIYAAEREKMTSVTEDQSLSKVARKHNRTVSIRELIADQRN
jgi:predicted nucleic acid-binding protein